MALVRYFNIVDADGNKVEPPAYMKHKGLCWQRVDGSRDLRGNDVVHERDMYGFATEEDCYNFIAPAKPAEPPCDEVVYYLNTQTCLITSNVEPDTFVNHLVEMKNGSILANKVTVPASTNHIITSPDGTTWAAGTDISPTPTDVHFVYQQQSGLQALYAGADDKLYRSLDNASTWSSVDVSSLSISAVTCMSELSGGELVIGTTPIVGATAPSPAVHLQSNTTTDLDTTFTNAGTLPNVSFNQAGAFSRVKHTTDPVKYGNSSVWFDQGGGDFSSRLVIMPKFTSYLRDSSNRYTLEMWIYIPDDSITVNNTVWLMNEFNAETGHGMDIKLGWNTDGWEVLCTIAGGSRIVRLWSKDNVITTNTWHHIAIVNNPGRNAAEGELTLYVDGVRPAEDVANSRHTKQYWTHDSSATSTQNFTTLGGPNMGGGFGLFDGYMQDIVFLAGVARYTGDTYTPPDDLLSFEPETPQVKLWKSDTNGTTWTSIYQEPYELESDQITTIQTLSGGMTVAAIVFSDSGATLKRGHDDVWTKHVHNQRIHTIVECASGNKLVAGTLDNAGVSMLTSTDQGENWTSKYFYNNDYGISSLFKITENHCVATLYDDVANYSRMLLSYDAGESWTPSMRTQDSLSGAGSVDHIYSAMYVGDGTDGKIILGTGASDVNIYTINKYDNPHEDKGGYKRDIVEVNNVYWTGDTVTDDLNYYQPDYCFYFNGFDSHMDIHLDQPLGTDDWCIECYVKIPADVVMTNNWRCIMSLGASNQAGAVQLYGTRNDAHANRAVAILNAWRNVNNINDTIGHELQIVDGKWHHIALSKYNNTTILYVDGLFDNKVQDTFNYTYKTLRVGHNDVVENESRFQGYIKDLRIIRGSPVYTGPFSNYLPVNMNIPSC